LPDISMEPVGDYGTYVGHNSAFDMIDIIVDMIATQLLWLYLY